jgi:glycosyltransferase involved in cell wall biosynthesis
LGSYPPDTPGHWWSGGRNLSMKILVILFVDFKHRRGINDYKYLLIFCNESVYICIHRLKNNELRILMIGPFPDPVTGVSVANDRLKSYLSKRGLKVNFIDTNFYNMSSHQGAKLPLKQIFHFIKRYSGLFKIFSSDIVYITPGQTFFGIVKYAPFILFALLLNKPYLIHLHGNYLGKEYLQLKGSRKYIFRFLISHARFGIALSHSLKENFKGLLQEDHITVIENFADKDLFLLDQESKEFSFPKVLFLSNLIKEKGILDVLDALIILKRKNVRFSAVLAGQMEEDIRGLLKEKLNELGPSVLYYPIVLGHLKTQVLREANVFILPTYYSMEGQPISVLEAMASGNTVICTRIPGITDIANENQVIFVDKQKPEEIATHLEALSQNMNKVKGFSLSNLQYADRRFRIEHFGEKIIDIFERSCKI